MGLDLTLLVFMPKKKMIAHVNTQRKKREHKPKGEVAKEPNYAYILISDFQPQNYEKVNVFSISHIISNT